MTQQPNGTKYKAYTLWEHLKNNPYDYENNGLVKRIVSKPLANTDNPTLQVILKFYEASIVFTLKYIDILKNFKNIHWVNR